MGPRDALYIALFLQHLVQEATGAAVPVEDVDLAVVRFVGAYLSADFFWNSLGVMMQLSGQTSNVQVTPSVHLDQIDDFTCERAAGDQQGVTLAAFEIESGVLPMVHLRKPREPAIFWFQKCAIGWSLGDSVAGVGTAYRLVPCSAQKWLFLDQDFARTISLIDHRPTLDAR